MRSTIHLSDHLLEQIARWFDRSCFGGIHHAALFVEPCGGDEAVFGVRAFADHPTDALGGLVAPSRWWAFALCTRGQEHFPDGADQEPEPIFSTFARSRNGHEVSLLRRGQEVTRLHGPAEGRVPDLVRAILSPRASTKARGPR